MANTVENTFNKIGNTIENIFGSASGAKQPDTNKGDGMGKASNLELYGIHARQGQLSRNEWSKTTQYTRQLVRAEYMIQTEFKVNSGGEPLTESQTNDKLEKLKNKQEKITKEINYLEGKKPKEKIS